MINTEYMITEEKDSRLITKKRKVLINTKM